MSDCIINWRFGTRHFQIHRNAPYITFSINLVRDDFERRARQIYISTAMTKLPSGEYFSPAVQKEWEAEKRKYASPLQTEGQK